MRRIRIARAHGVVTREDPSDARVGERLRGIKRNNFRMRAVAAHEMRVELMGGVPVGGVLAGARDQTEIFDAAAVGRVRYVLVHGGMFHRKIGRS
jgi:hypothetical protein